MQFIIYAYIIFAIVKLPELDKEAQIAEDEAQKVINEITDQWGNHNISFVIECQKLYYESEQGITLLTGSILKENYTELIDCFQEQIKQYQKDKDNRAGFACYDDMSLDLFQSVSLLDGKLVDLYKRKAEFSKYLFYRRFSLDVARKLKQQMKN
ncbi:unnamed protein product [Schistosoma rodhaini]|nr:unnamed protein product [Schistosoma rodhaini]